jgi:hypothetical protein
MQAVVLLQSYSSYRVTVVTSNIKTSSSFSFEDEAICIFWEGLCQWVDLDYSEKPLTILNICQHYPCLETAVLSLWRQAVLPVLLTVALLWHND